MAVNLRLALPEAVADLPIDHFDGLDTFDDRPSDEAVCTRPVVLMRTGEFALSGRIESPTRHRA